MKLIFKGNYLKNKLNIIVGKERKMIKSNQCIEFDLQENTNYIISIESFDEENKMKSIFDTLFKMPNMKGYLHWYETIDAIKMKATFDYINHEDCIILLDYIESCYRLETEKWYFPILSIDGFTTINYTYYCSDFALNKGCLQQYLALVYAIHIIFLLCIIGMIQSDLLYRYRYLRIFGLMVFFYVLFFLLYYLFNKDKRIIKEHAINQIKDLEKKE